MLFNKNSSSTLSDHIPNTHQSLLSSNQSGIIRAQTWTNDGSESTKGQFALVRNYQQNLGFGSYFLLVFTNVFYVIWESMSIFGLIKFLNDGQSPVLIAIIFIIVGICVIAFLNHICLKLFVFRLLDKAQRKTAFLIGLKNLQNSDT